MNEQISTAHASNAEQRRQFEYEGYALFPGVLSQDQVTEMRAFLADLFAAKPVYDGDSQLPVQSVAGRGGGVRLDIFNRYPELRVVLAQPMVAAALRSLLGDDFVLVRESAAHDSRYGYWHKDTTPMERAGLDFHYMGCPSWCSRVEGVVGVAESVRRPIIRRRTRAVARILTQPPSQLLNLSHQRRDLLTQRPVLRPQILRLIRPRHAPP